MPNSHTIENEQDLVRVLMQFEDEYGLVPDMCDGGLWIDSTAPRSQELERAIGAWGVERHRLIAGEITQEEYDAWKQEANR